MSTATPARGQSAPSVFTRVTNLVLAELAQGTAPWRKPWRADFGLPRNLASGKAYRGVNILTLMTTALGVPYPANWWLTYQQARARGGQVRKGEHGVPILFYQPTPLAADGQSRDEAAEETAPFSRQRRPVLKVYTVFNVAQCSGVPTPAPLPPASDPVQAAEQLVSATHIPIRYQGSQAYYQPARDLITLPPRGAFESTAGFYGTLLHELVHATGHPSRLDRPSDTYGTPAYAWEELIAELGSAMLATITGVPSPDFSNSAAYVQSWRTRLQGDPRAIAEAAAAAQQAVEWLLQQAGLPWPA